MFTLSVKREIHKKSKSACQMNFNFDKANCRFSKQNSKQQVKEEVSLSTLIVCNFNFLWDLQTRGLKLTEWLTDQLICCSDVYITVCYFLNEQLFLKIKKVHFGASSLEQWRKKGFQAFQCFCCCYCSEMQISFWENSFMLSKLRFFCCC